MVTKVLSIENLEITYEFFALMGVTYKGGVSAIEGDFIYLRNLEVYWKKKSEKLKG